MMDLFSTIQPTQDALAIQQLRMQVIAENIAHAQTTMTESGGAYQRREVVFSSFFDKDSKGLSQELPRIHVEGIETDDTPGPTVHQPGHPHANDEGYVTYPNVAVSLEMVDLMQAARAYEANLQAVRTAKDMAEKAMSISMG